MDTAGHRDNAPSPADPTIPVRAAQARLVKICRDVYGELMGKVTLHWYGAQVKQHFPGQEGSDRRKPGPRSPLLRHLVPATADTLRKMAEQGSHLAPETFGPVVDYLRKLDLVDAKMHAQLRRVYREAFLEYARARLALHGFFDHSEISLDEVQPGWEPGLYYLVEASAMGGFPPLERTAHVQVRMPNGEIRTGRGTGLGPLEAVDDAIQSLLPRPFVSYYRFQVVGRGVRAHARVTVTIQDGDAVFHGQRTLRDLVGAGGLALIDALNKQAAHARSGGQA